MSKHFAELAQDQTTPEAHYFEQLRLDLEWAAGAAKTFVERDGRDRLSALHTGFHAIAGRRWSRFKQSEKSGDKECASEMEAFGLFWYQVANAVEQMQSVEPGSDSGNDSGGDYNEF